MVPAGRHRIALQYYENKGISFEKMDSLIRLQFFISATYTIWATHSLIFVIFRFVNKKNWDENDTNTVI